MTSLATDSRSSRASLSTEKQGLDPVSPSFVLLLDDDDDDDEDANAATLDASKMVLYWVCKSCTEIKGNDLGKDSEMRNSTLQMVYKLFFLTRRVMATCEKSMASYSSTVARRCISSMNSFRSNHRVFIFLAMESFRVTLSELLNRKSSFFVDGIEVDGINTWLGVGQSEARGKLAHQQGVCMRSFVPCM